MVRSEIKEKHAGFSLIEVMIALAISGIVMAAIYAVYIVQVKGMISQETMLDMQQTVRAALNIMENEIQMAGCDPTQKAKATILKAGKAELSFTMDVQNHSGWPQPDGDTNDGNEYIRYALNKDADRNGQADRIPCDLGRDTGGGLQPFAENIDALNFVYLDNGGNPLPAGFTTDQIRAVQVTIVARSGEKLRWMLSVCKDTHIYRNKQGEIILPAQNDNFRRLMLTSTVFCRNIKKKS